MHEEPEPQSPRDGSAPPAAGQSRRTFLKTVGLAAGSLGLLSGVHEAAAQDTTTATAGTDGLTVYGRAAAKFSLEVNGKAVAVTAEPRETLLDVLRDQLGLTGAKEVCSRGACGGCTVLLDGEAVCGCHLLALDAVGRRITTVEGIAADPKYAALVDSFCEHDGAQCGFCIPGFVVRSAELVTAGQCGTFDQVREGLAGNICRCGTYSKIFDAVLAAGGGAK